jgi:hypothetical protein
LGSVESRGVEFNVNYRIINKNSKGIVWTIMVNGIHNEDRIKSVSNYVETVTAANDGSQVDQTRPQPHYVVGQSLTGIWAVKPLGIDPEQEQKRFECRWYLLSMEAANKTLAGDLSPKLQGHWQPSPSKNISAEHMFQLPVWCIILQPSLGRLC